METKSCKDCKWFTSDDAGGYGWCCANDVDVSSDDKVCEDNFEEDDA